ncbi:hypothetical protein PFFVO_05494, partial [Plasmodium falciparum Vietnam Oak-Knoll (FVO)]
MGANESSISKTVVGKETHMSARNVLENIARIIKEKASNDAKRHRNVLKGYLSQAKFYHPFSKERPYYKSACDLDYAFHSNTPGNRREFRHPCYGRQAKNNSKLEGAVCTNSKIKGNEEKINGAGACAPYRRRHMCDLNLEHIDVHNTKNSNDLLGNILVTAKYEGESIVKNHPNRGSSEVCIALARSFADIGDIVRGRDMFKPNDKDAVWNGLRAVFKKINDNLKEEGIRDYDDGSGNYVKLREDWWTANRDQVWKALTCFAHNTEEYFIKSEDGTKSFTNPKCGHDENKVLTNLDYVPQFLRWFNEWAEDFCRIKNIKIEHVTKTCTGESNNKHCSREGYDCKRTDLKKNEIFMDLECPRCEEECTSYNEWLKKKEGEFNKQKKKYKKEIENNQSNSHSTYDNELYNNLKRNYPSFEKFVETLKEGAYCTNGIIEGKIDFNKQYDTFSHSQYCKSCPIFNLKCANGKCNSLDDIKCPKIQTATNIRTYKIEKPIDINILVNNNKKIGLSPELKDDFNDCDLFKRLRRQEWKCKYKCNLDVCELQNFHKGIDDEKHMLIEVLIKRWLKYFLNDYNQIKENLNQCINNGTNTLCIKDCYKNCDCVEKWIKEKEEEWKDIKARYIEQYESKDEVFSSKLKTFLKQDMFKNYIGNALNKNEKLDKMKEPDGCNEPNKSNGKSCKNNDVITILLNRLQKEMNSCKTQHKESNNQKSCDKTTKIINDDEEDDEEDDQDKPRILKNPCVNSRDQKVGNVKSVRDVAEEMQKEVKKGMLERSVKEGDKGKSGNSCLVGDITLAKFGKAAKSSGLNNGKFCQLDKNKHSNAERKNRAYTYQGPCTGKNQERFKIGTDWKDGDFVSTTHKEVFMPPRREHICTSNLENLDIKSEGLSNGSFSSHSLLGDVFLSAKYEAENIKKLYQQNNSKIKLTEEKDKESICRALRYSFADLGDIIRGKDLWDHKDFKKLEKHLQKIFGKIKEELKSKINDKYEDNSEGKHTKFREDWWEANRAKVWEAMQCPKKIPPPGVDIKCDQTGVPLDDYIPQRLRWMIEWAEWYCKYQSQEYEKLKRGCEGCRSKGGQCKNGESMCNSCTKACNTYKENINKWQKQWKQIKQKYDDLYQKAKQNGVTSSDKDADVVKFLKQLHKENGGGKSGATTAYSTAEGYVHQELPNMGCNVQTQFCKHKNGSTSSDGKDNDKEYAFREKPHDHDDKCTCTDKSTPPRRRRRAVLRRGVRRFRRRRPPPPPPPPEGLGRSDTGIPPQQPALPGPTDDSESEEEEEEEPAKESSTTEVTKQGSEPPATTQNDVNVCEIVEDLLDGKDGTSKIDGCELKTKGAYPPWKCDSTKIKRGEEGACMPPRRIKLCVNNLQQLSEQASPEQLRKAFIECAAIETYWLWHKYKDDKKKDAGGEQKSSDVEAQNQLESGTIPEKFKRQMFYTYGDYRDLCLDKDIGTDVDKVKSNIKKVFENSNRN